MFLEIGVPWGMPGLGLGYEMCFSIYVTFRSNGFIACHFYSYLSEVRKSNRQKRLNCLDPKEFCKEINVSFVNVYHV